MNNEKESKKIKSIRIIISSSLNKEIEYALRNLKLSEQQKKQGERKKNWTKLEASHQLGIFLKSQRKERKI